MKIRANFRGCHLRRSSAKRQQGAALATGLILLLALSITGVTVISQSVQDEKMTGNQKQSIDAFLAAEAGLSNAKYYLEDNWEDRLRLKESDPEEELLSDVEFSNKNNANLTYSVYVRRLDQDMFGLRSEGRVETVRDGETIATTARTLTANFVIYGGINASAPAAISCFGGSCDLQGGAGNRKAKVDGRDHAVPGEDCSGSSCWNDPLGSSDENKPALFLDDYENSFANSGGGNFAYCGTDAEGEGDECSGKAKGNKGNLLDSDPDWATTGSDYTEAPSGSEFFGDGAPQESQILDVGSNREGVMVVDGETVPESGTGYFSGVVIIKNCGKLDLSGNFNVYGAVVVDSSGCEDDYNPFEGSGTPSVRYSSEALGNVGPLFGDRMGLADWDELIRDD